MGLVFEVLRFCGVGILHQEIKWLIWVVGEFRGKGLILFSYFGLILGF